VHEKKKSHVNQEDYIHTSLDDISDALYLAITSHDLPYTKDTFNRITPVTYDEGKILAQYFLDYNTPTQRLLAQTEFVVAQDGDVTVDRVHTKYVKGSGSVPFVATV
jgi:hypothetical protein